MATWPDLSYAFPPPRMLSKAQTKIEEGGVTAIVVAPRWTTTPCWDRLVDMVVEEMVELGRSRDVCTTRPGARLLRLPTLVATVVRGSGASSIRL